MSSTLDTLSIIGPELTDEQLDDVAGGLVLLDIVVILVIIAFFP